MEFPTILSQNFNGEPISWKLERNRTYCVRVILVKVTILFRIFISAQGMDMMERGSHVCNKDLVQSLMFDARVTENFQDLKLRGSKSKNP